MLTDSEKRAKRIGIIYKRTAHLPLVDALLDEIIRLEDKNRELNRRASECDGIYQSRYVKEVGEVQRENIALKSRLDHNSLIGRIYYAFLNRIAYKLIDPGLALDTYTQIFDVKNEPGENRGELVLVDGRLFFDVLNEIIERAKIKEE